MVQDFPLKVHVFRNSLNSQNSMQCSQKLVTEAYSATIQSMPSHHFLALTYNSHLCLPSGLYSSALATKLPLRLLVYSQKKKKKILFSKDSGSDEGDGIDWSLLGHHAALTGRWLPRFQRSTLHDLQIKTVHELHPEDGGTTILQNVGNSLPVYTA
jgi:hypothetical protein